RERNVTGVQTCALPIWSRFHRCFNRSDDDHAWSSETSISSAAGCFGRPGMVIIAPVKTTMKPAPIDGSNSLILTVKPDGRPIRQIGRAPGRVGARGRDE